MAARLGVLALLAVALATAVAARELQQAQITVANLPKQLQDLNKRLTALATTAAVKKATNKRPATGLAGLVSAGADDAYYSEQQEEESYAPDAAWYGRHQQQHQQQHGARQHYYSEEPAYESYAPSKVTVKLYEKFRSHLRPQAGNANTFQFTSELTCQNPAAESGPEHDDGIIGFPIVSERMKLVTVGVCEWTVTQVKEQRISEHAALKGSTNVVCSFTDEAARQCKNGDVLQEGVTVTGQGLVYNFDNTQEEYKRAARIKAAKDKDGEAAEEEAGMDVYLTMINGVVNAGKKLRYDNGALQFFFGKPVDTASEGAMSKRTFLGETKKGDPTGELTFVFKS